MKILAADRLNCEIASPTQRERYRAALRDRDFAERQLSRLQRQLDVQTHSGSGDAIDRLRQVQMARELLGPACARLRDAIERCIALRPASRPRPRREPVPTVWLNTPAPRASARSMPYLTRDMGNLRFPTAEAWLDYTARTTGWRRGGRP